MQQASNDSACAHAKRGMFITFEGIDGAGKSTHINRVVNFIRDSGFNVVATREPGGTPLGEQLREIALNQTMHLETEALIMFAARREHLDKVIDPAIERGDWVVCDRFSDATYAYQGGGRGLDKGKFEQLEQWVHAHRHPDLTFLFDVSPDEASRRICAQGRVLDKFEAEKIEFHTRVRNAYLERASDNPERFVVLNGALPIDSISQLVLAKIQTLIEILR